MTQKHFLFYPFVFLTFLTTLFGGLGCGVTEKTVNRGDASTSSSGAGTTGEAQTLSVTSHFAAQRIDNQTETIAGTCANGAGDITISGDVQGGSLTTPCNSGLFSVAVTFVNFNSNNSFTVSQGSESLPFVFELFARAAYCGDGKVNQDWEICDGSADCTDKCETATLKHADLVLARVKVDELLNEGNGEQTVDIFLGSETLSIPNGTWFVVFFNGSFFVDGSTDDFNGAPGVIVRRLTNEIKVLMNTELTASDLEHIEGRVEFHNATATGISEGIGTESLENGQDGISQLNADQDEIFIESGASRFWFTERTGRDAYFTDWD